MCGITGFWQQPHGEPSALAEQVAAMTETLRHRGPDDGGIWVDERVGVALGFRRLAIIDLSPVGHQPMMSVEERYTIVFNGEIYNYRELKAELHAEGHRFRGGSDTEVVLAGFSRWGITRTLGRITGMFAIAAWDAEVRALTLARDRIGKKPLYYGRVGDAWVFGSELKALRRYPGFRPEVDREALMRYLQFTYVPGPMSIYKGIRKLPPAHYVTISRGATATPVPYWDPAVVAQRGQQQPLQIGDREAVEQLDALLRDAVAHRMIADVPLGAFLSGGIDSSTVVALMQAQSAEPVRTFSIGFDNVGYNEAEAAKAVALHLGTDHTELYITSDEARAVIPALPDIFDEPFADSSQVPTYLLSAMARSHVTVSLSGDGGDELFGGYNRYFWAPRIWRWARMLPLPLRRRLCALVEDVPAERLDEVYRVVQAALPASWRLRLPGDKAHKLARVLGAATPMDLYGRLTSAWQRPEDLLLDAVNLPVQIDPYLPAGFVERMMYKDLLTYLPDDILVKVDRASMAIGLEVRAPLLDHRVVEWAWRLPMDLRVRNGTGKWLLRQVLDRYVPQKLIDRPKMGFGVPIDEWLRGPLRDWAEDLLTERALTRSGFRTDAIRDVWSHHLTGRRNEHARLWPVLMFQAWRRRWMP